ncbi:dihydrolipoamide acetyltransferase family protein [Antrihabitans sp. YC2-6]|uniref:dihydrolipoamide acetyltransferase family protein n=1 Tax=Antrihabitans sp. YC2-6 TaxID=2799498 RepID=UPI0018F665E3|nr:dihydrolipoamide acetyltransferase family protein [Antrihabitans sp. YC2-6]MBJ8348099.1 2-oxo acid dehydrogenase subunit E2 [Antrihabitans sp. YC2-6]
MAQDQEFRLPDLGEGLTEADLVSWSVAPGDHIELNQTIAEVETAKALVELPSPFAGIVAELLVSAGDTVPVGTPIIRVTTDAVVRQDVLVGYGPSAAPESRRRKRVLHEAVPEAHMATDSSTATTPGRPDAKPSARQLARELDVDLAVVSPAGRAITVDDVRAHRASPVSVAIGERETRTKIAGVRKHTAEAMVTSVRTIPHVTEFVTVDVTATVELLEHLRTTPQFQNVKLTPLAFVSKVVTLTLAQHPTLNSSWDDDNHEIVTKHYVNLGIAVATPRGLMVPSIKDAQDLGLRELCESLSRLAEKTRAGDATPGELRGGTFSITNIGVFGVDTGTPIINPGEAGILCLGSIGKRPWVVDDEVAVRWVTTLGLSFDHRLVDGEQGSKFLAAIAATLHDPLTLLARI